MRSMILPVLAMLSVPAFAAPARHAVYSDDPYSFEIDSAPFRRITSAEAGFMWTEGTTSADGTVTIQVYNDSGFLRYTTYTIDLVSVSSADDYEIRGRFDVKVNGILLCNDCLGEVYGLNSPLEKGIYVDIGNRYFYGDYYSFVGVITDRIDF